MMSFQRKRKELEHKRQTEQKELEARAMLSAVSEYVKGAIYYYNSLLERAYRNNQILFTHADILTEDKFFKKIISYNTKNRLLICLQNPEEIFKVVSKWFRRDIGLIPKILPPQTNFDPNATVKMIKHRTFLICQGGNR